MLSIDGVPVQHTHWKCRTVSNKAHADSSFPDWYKPGFNDVSWKPATVRNMYHPHIMYHRHVPSTHHVPSTQRDEFTLYLQHQRISSRPSKQKSPMHCFMSINSTLLAYHTIFLKETQNHNASSPSSPRPMLQQYTIVITIFMIRKTYSYI
jgi:hypothetical protein